MYVDLKVGFALSIKIRLMINMYAQTTLQSRNTLITLLIYNAAIMKVGKDLIGYTIHDRNTLDKFYPILF